MAKGRRQGFTQNTIQNINHKKGKRKEGFKNSLVR
jgi:hypothetical protein